MIYYFRYSRRIPVLGELLLINRVVALLIPLAKLKTAVLFMTAFDNDDLNLTCNSQYIQDYPYEDDDAKLEMSRQGKYILTEAEIAFDAADIFRAGRDIFIQISQVPMTRALYALKINL